jgi:hypothetical protein
MMLLRCDRVTFVALSIGDNGAVAQFGGQVERVAAEAPGDIVAQGGVFQEAAGVAGAGKGGVQIAFGGEIELTGDQGGIGNAGVLKAFPNGVT